MTDARHAQVDEVLLLQAGQMAALDVVVHEGVSVLGQVEALQPVGHVLLAPGQNGLGGEGLVGGGLDEGEGRGRAAAARAQAEGRRGQPEHVRHCGGGDRGRK